MTYRAAFFTLNNWTPAEREHLISLVPDTCNYMAFGHEVGEKKKTPHLQGYCELNKQYKFKALKEVLGKRVSFRFRRGTQKQAITYCEKGGTFFEWGKLKKQGERNDLNEIRLLALESGMRAVVREGNYQQMRVAEKYLEYCEPPRNWKTKVYWYWGDSGIGKSFAARRLTAEMDCYCLAKPRKDGGDIWWAGYDGHKAVIIDDIDPSWFPIKFLLDALDRYECRVENKGGTRQLRAKRIYITSIKEPSRTYFDPHGELNRRITKIIHLSSVTEVGGNTKAPTSSPDHIGDMSEDRPVPGATADSLDDSSDHAEGQSPSVV